jgi:hypothetical protein
VKFSKIVKLVIVTAIILIIAGLVVWTLISPKPLAVLSQSQLQNGLFGSSETTAGYNITDASGTYHFEFGIDYSKNLTSNSATRVAVYCALVNEQITSFFTKGVALILQSSSFIIDGKLDSNVVVKSNMQPNLQTYYFEIQNLQASIGNDTLQVRMFLSTVDVNYIGSSVGTYQTVVLNGTFGVSS